MENVVLVDYLEQVKKYLPPWKSEEILKEIRSHFFDQAESIAAERGVSVDENVTREVISKLGPPEKLAAGYLQPVTLIRPEYTTHFLFYSAILVAFQAIQLFFGGEFEFFIVNSLLSIGLVFVFLAVLSRLPKIYHLPLWFRRWRGWRGRLAKGGEQVFEKAWNQEEKKMDNTSAPTMTLETKEMNIAAPTSPETQNTKSSWSQPWQAWIDRSGPRPLGPVQMFAASLKIMLGLALGIYLIAAPSPIPFFGINLDHPTEGFQLLLSSPGLEELRPLALFACVLTVISGALSLYLGICRTTLLSSIAGKAVWITLWVSLLVTGNLLIADFKTVNEFVLRDWVQEVRPALFAAAPFLLFAFILFQSLTTIGKFVRLGRLEAWYQTQKRKNAPTEKVEEKLVEV